MATQRSQKQEEVKKDEAAAGTTAVAEVNTSALAKVDDDMFAADAGAGLENTNSDSYAIPFITILQKGSPQVDETSGVAIEGAKAGMIFENVTGAMFDGKDGVLVVPCAYRQVYLRWGPRSGEGAGFKGELAIDQVAKMRDEGKVKELDGKLYVPLADGSVNDKKCDRISDTRNHYVLLIDESTGAWTTALLSLTSTQIRKSKLLMAMIAGVKRRHPQTQQMYRPASFANMVRLTTVPESNDKGSWYGARFDMEGFVESREVYEAAKLFHDSVIAGHVQAKYEDTEAAGGEAGSGSKF